MPATVNSVALQLDDYGQDHYTVKPNLETALDYHYKGWVVIPLHTIQNNCCTCGNSNCKSPGKHPHISGWNKEGYQPDEEQVRIWWKKWPDANIGIVTGKTSDVVVMDVDPRHEGNLYLDGLEDSFGKLPDTIRSKTGGGGEHIFFKYTEKIRNNKTSFLNGLDIRSNGGFVVAPRSLHVSGKRYEWHPDYHPDDMELTEMPDWLIDIILKKNESQQSSTPNVVQHEIPEGKRHTTLVSLAGTMQNRGMSEIAIREALLNENQEKCTPPLSDDEVKQIVKNVAKYEPGNIQNSNLPVVVQTTNRKSVKSLIPDAPLKDSIIFPQDYKYSSKAGISTTIQRGKGIITVPVSPVMIIITGRMENIEHETESLEIAWLRDGEWKLIIIDRETIAKHSTITELARYGCPVTSTSAKYLVDYLAKFEHENLTRFPSLRVSDILGWQKDKVAFLWGYNLIRLDGSVVNTKDIDGVLKENSSEDLVVFRGSDVGDNQIARAFYAQGTYEEWIEAINSVFQYPRVISLVYFSLMTPFLDILGVNNFTVDLAFVTSTGKTSTLRIAGSVWGNPDEYSHDRLLFSWDGTNTWLERAASMLRGLPYILDDTKRARYKETISDLIYSISNGQSRGRGTPDGMRETGSFRTILLTCGEQSAVDYSENGGSRGRAISLWGPVFTDKNVREHVDRLNNVVKSNFGHAGPKVIQFILKNRDQWKLWQNTYYEYQKYYADKAGSNTIAQRVSAYFAGLATTIPLIHAALPELRRDYPVRDIIEHLWNAAINNSEELDPAVRALSVLYSWAVSNQDKFWNKQKAENDRIYEPHNGWAGRWEEGDYIGFNTQTVTKILSDAGFDAKAMLKLWKDKDWLLYNEGNRTKQLVINGIKVRYYCIKQSVIEKELKLSPDEDSDEDNRF